MSENESESGSNPPEAPSRRAIMLSALRRLCRHPATSAIFLVLAIAFFLAWKLQIVPYATAWGDLGTWISAIFTGGGLVFAGVSAKSAASSVRAQTEQKKQQEVTRTADETERRTAMAHSVAISSWWARDKVGRWRVCYRLANKSPYPVSQVTVRVWDILGDDAWANKAYAHTYDNPNYDLAFERVLGTLLPDDVVAESIHINHPMAGPRPIIPVDPAAVRFTDVWGKHWIRTDSSTVESDAPACMCEGCQQSIPEARIRKLPTTSPERPQRV